LRADADAGVKVYTSKKTILPGDTASLVISFEPSQAGSFRRNIRLVSSDQAAPYELRLSGNIEKLAVNNKTACYYFGSAAPRGIRTPQAVPNLPDTARRDNSNRMPDNSSVPAPPVSAGPGPASKPGNKPVAPQPEQNIILPENEYRPNNILFLVDVSGSMRDSLKLPLMKLALHTLIDAVRNVDSVTFVTYSDTVKIISESVSGAQKAKLHNVVDGLKARGMTKGRTAILISQSVAQKHFIRGGNNQIIMATDGKFRFEDEDHRRWKDKQGEKKIVLSTVAFGSDKEALRTLKAISRRTGGSFIRINSRGEDKALLDEIRERSRIR
jgi:Mg-chelatase subunit ChlD